MEWDLASLPYMDARIADQVLGKIDELKLTERESPLL